MYDWTLGNTSMELLTFVEKYRCTVCIGCVQGVHKFTRGVFS